MNNMRHLFIALFCLSSYIVSGQDEEYQVKIDSLTELKTELEEQIAPLQQRLSNIQGKLDSLDAVKLTFERKLLMESGVEAVLRSEGKIRSKPSPVGEILSSIPAGSKVVLIKYYDGYYEGSYDGKEGWISHLYLQSSPELDKLASGVLQNNLLHNTSNSSTYSAKTTSTRSSYSRPSSSSGKVYVKGHYRTVNGKKVYVKPHTRSKPKKY